MYPLDPKADYWEIPIEASKPEYPGASLLGRKLPMKPEIVRVSRALLETTKAIAFGSSEAFEFPPGDTWDQFNIQSALLIALHPKIGAPWELGIHQCSYPRVWNGYERDLFTEISRRISDSLNNWLFFQKLNNSEKRYRELVENLNECVAVYDAVENGSDFMFKDYNKAAEKADQITRAELLGKTICEIFPRVHEFGLLDVFKKVWKTGVPEHHPITLYEDQRIQGWRENYVYKLPSGEIVAVYQDMTEKMKLDQKLRDSEKLYHNLYEEAPIVYLSIGTDKTILLCNKAAVGLLGYSKEELLNKHVFDLYPDNHNGLVKARQLFKRFLNGETIYDEELQMKKKNGELFWISLTVNPILDREGNIIQSRSMIVDITERKKAERLIREENLKLIELSKLRKDLITRISHELKTPFTSIFGMSQLLMMPKEELDENISTQIKILNRGCLRLKLLIDDLLDVSRLDSKKIELKIQEVNLLDLIRETIDDIRYLATNRSQKIKVDVPKGLFVKVDKIRISQAISNILTNAFKNTPSEGTIFIHVKNMKDWINISVKDTGVGLTEKELERLFQKFGKIERYGMNLDVDIEGVGLGLYISKEIIELHGGQILVESEGRNKGATFTIRLYK